jgi:hypothetical protein
MRKRWRHWRILVQHWTHRKTALIFHLTNHYALIFALREYVSVDGEERRCTKTNLRSTLLWGLCIVNVLGH